MNMVIHFNIIGSSDYGESSSEPAQRQTEGNH